MTVSTLQDKYKLVRFYLVEISDKDYYIGLAEFPEVTPMWSNSTSQTAMTCSEGHYYDSWGPEKEIILEVENGDITLAESKENEISDIYYNLYSGVTSNTQARTSIVAINVNGKKVYTLFDSPSIAVNLATTLSSLWVIPSGGISIISFGETSKTKELEVKEEEEDFVPFKASSLKVNTVYYSSLSKGKFLYIGHYYVSSSELSTWSVAGSLVKKRVFLDKWGDVSLGVTIKTLSEDVKTPETFQKGIAEKLTTALKHARASRSIWRYGCVLHSRVISPVKIPTYATDMSNNSKDIYTYVAGVNLKNKTLISTIEDLINTHITDEI